MGWIALKYKIQKNTNNIHTANYCRIRSLNHFMPYIPKWRTHNNNSAAFAAELLLCVWPFGDIGHERVKFLHKNC